MLPTYSFVSLTEISEYVPTVEQYGRRLIEDGETEGSDVYLAKLDAYRRRERDLPAAADTRLFRLAGDVLLSDEQEAQVGENWFLLPFEERNRMMNEHARSGMAFAGHVSQLITVSVGLDDWEWGVTLWAANPQFLTHIVYQMRFDEASARYAEFGPFIVSYVCTPAEMLAHCQIDG